jgi:hypothetical protein
MQWYKENKLKTFLIDEKLANGILQYLGKQPYIEVFPFVQGLQMLETLEDKKEEKES